VAKLWFIGSPGFSTEALKEIYDGGIAPPAVAMLQKLVPWGKDPAGTFC